MAERDDESTLAFWGWVMRLTRGLRVPVARAAPPLRALEGERRRQAARRVPIDLSPGLGPPRRPPGSA